MEIHCIMGLLCSHVQISTYVLCRHEGPVWQVDWAHPKFGCILASCSYDRRVIVWKETNRKWEIFHEFREHKSSGKSAAMV